MKIPKTFNLRERTIDLLKSIASKEDETQGNIIDKAVEQYAKDHGYS